MNKQDFLDHLASGEIAASQNQAELAMLPETVFEPFDDSLPIVEHTFGTDYFDKQFSKLKYANFAKKRCEHLIAVKAEMQKMGVAGFAVSSQSQQIVQAAEQLNREVGARLAKYRPEADFQAAVQEKNTDRVRAFIKRDLNSEYVDAEDVSDMAWYVQRNFPQAFDAYEQDEKFRKPFNEDQSVWHYDYFINQQNPLNMNFALERVLHLVQVRDVLRRKGVPEFQKLDKAALNENIGDGHKQHQQSKQPKSDFRQPENRTQAHSGYHSSPNEPNLPLKTALIIGGSILILIALSIAVFR